MDSSSSTLKLAFDLAFDDLYCRDGLIRLDRAFLGWVGEADAGLRARLDSARADPGALAAKEESDLLIALSPLLEDFLCRLFGIESEVQSVAARHHELAPLYSVKRLFVQRRALHKVKAAELEAFDAAAGEAQLAALVGEPFSELAFARSVTAWQKDEAAHAAARFEIPCGEGKCEGGGHDLTANVIAKLRQGGTEAELGGEHGVVYTI